MFVKSFFNSYFFIRKVRAHEPEPHKKVGLGQKAPVFMSRGKHIKRFEKNMFCSQFQ